MSDDLPFSKQSVWLLVTLICLWILSSTGFEALEYAQSINWEKTTGVIAAIPTSGDELDDELPAAKPKLKYRYRVNDKDFESTRVFFAEFRHADHGDSMDRFEPNSEVTVYFNPANPSQSVLERRLATSGCVWFAMSLVGLAVVSRKLDEQPTANSAVG